MAGTFELLAVLIVSAVLTPDVVELGRMSQVDGGRAEESKLNDDESNTDDDDNDDVNGLKMPADGEEDPKENGDDWSVVPKYSNTERYQYVAKKDDDSEVRFALRLCQSSTLKIAFIPVGQDDGIFDKAVLAIDRKRVSKVPDRYNVEGEPAERKRSKSKRGGKRHENAKRDHRLVEEDRELCGKTVTDLFFHCMKESDYFKVNGSIELYRRTVARGINLEASTFSTGSCYGNKYLKVGKHGLTAHGVVLFATWWGTCFDHL